MSRVLVSGGAGFTGRYLVRLLAERGHEVHAAARFEGETVEGAAAVHAADLTDPAAVDAIVARVRPERVVHLAAIANVAHGDVAEMYRSNILATRQLLQSLSATADRPQAVLVASSANIYGNRREGLLDEGMPPAPTNDYGVTKVATEALAGMYADRLPITLVRPFNYTGRGQSTDFLIPKIVDHARRRAPVIELGNLDVARDFSDVRAVVEVYARLLDRAEGGGPFNVCSGQAVTLRELLERVERVSGHPMEVRVGPGLVRANEVRVLAGSAQRLEAAIGPLPSIPLDETLAWMLG